MEVRHRAIGRGCCTYIIRRVSFDGQVNHEWDFGMY